MVTSPGLYTASHPKSPGIHLRSPVTQRIITQQSSAISNEWMDGFTHVEKKLHLRIKDYFE